MSPNRIPGGASGGPLDLAERLRLAGAPLRAMLRRREALEEIVREAYSDMDPSRIGRMLVGRASAWIPLDAWALLADDGTGQLTLLHAQGRADADDPVLSAVATAVLTASAPLAGSRTCRAARRRASLTSWSMGSSRSVRGRFARGTGRCDCPKRTGWGIPRIG